MDTGCLYIYVIDNSVQYVLSSE